MNELADAFPELFALPPDERAALGQALWESVMAEEEAEELTPAFVIELDRRIAGFRADPSTGIPWEVVQAAAAQRRAAKRDR